MKIKISKTDKKIKKSPRKTQNTKPKPIIFEQEYSKILDSCYSGNPSWKLACVSNDPVTVLSTDTITVAYSCPNNISSNKTDVSINLKISSKDKPLTLKSVHLDIYRKIISPFNLLDIKHVSK